MKQEEYLAARLAAYGASEMYPFHMPGHKRWKGLEGGGFEDFQNPFAIDITEIHGFDNLHHPEGILRTSMERTAALYGADKSFYLINGSSCGLLAAISGCVKRGGHILISRNCHKSVYHGIYINGLRASYVYPQSTGALGIQGGISCRDVENCLEREPGIEAVLIVSPTYDGMVSEIREIAEAVHKKGLPLIVDEAHGAHFRYREEFPVSALELGADVVIQSVHKTLPCLTQTALLHIKRNRPDGGCYGPERRIERYLHMYQSSSPSYVLMASAERGIGWMEENRSSEQMERYIRNLTELRQRLSGMKRLRLVGRELAGSCGIYDVDLSKLVVSCADSGLTGPELAERLRRHYRLEMEMCGPDYVVAITTVMDSEEGLRRLGDALLELDGELTESGKGRGERPDGTYSRGCEAVMTLSQAMDGESEQVRLTQSRGRISAEFVYIYPPGIPIVAPGERISGESLALVREYIRRGLPVQGPEDETLEWIRVVKEG